MLNRLRHEHPALHLLRGLHVHNAEDDATVVFSKVSTADTSGGGSTPGERDIVIVVVNVDPHSPRETMIHLDMPALGMDWEERFVAHDEVTGAEWTWGAYNYVRLDPFHEPAHIITVRRASQA
jgi:starch synthase (maltosyl-transferring)